MGIVSAALTARRFTVLSSELPEGWRDLYRERLNELAFKAPPSPSRSPVHGWCLIDNLMGTSFDDFNDWLLTEWILFSLRIDKRKIPAKRFKAELDKRCATWAQEAGLGRCPASRRSEIKEQLEDEWIGQVMPSSSIVEIAWNLTSHRIYVSSHSDNMCEEVRKRFYRTFGLRMVPTSPLEWIGDQATIDEVLACPPTRFGEVPE